MWHLPIAVLLLCLPATVPAQAPAPEPPRWTFGVSLATGQHSELFSLFLVQEHGLHVLRTEPIGRGQFVLQAQGTVPSKANPEGENLFLRHKVEGCLHPEDSTAGVEDCGVFDDLWKLRFWEYPFLKQDGQRTGRGWAENPYTPSPRQMIMLTDFGILHVSGMARGENAFNLLRAVGDPEWVERYRRGE
jgi:hypothetical protein